MEIISAPLRIEKTSILGNISTRYTGVGYRINTILLPLKRVCMFLGLVITQVFEKVN